MAQNIVTYAGSTGKERFHAVVQLSNGTFLVAGQATDLNWLPSSVTKTPLSIGTINSASAGNIGFIMQLSSDLTKILSFVHFPQNTVRDVSFIKTTNDPCQPTGDMFISGNRDVTDYNQDGYFIAKLNKNFVNGVPTSLVWSYNVICRPRKAGGFQGVSAFKELQPWDVGGDGKVVFGAGSEYDTEWAEIRRLDTNGKPEVVENWLAHWFDGGEWDGTPAATYPNKATKPLVYSAIVLKAGRKGSLRSYTQAQYDGLMDDGNGSKTRKGSFPDDYYFSGPCAFEGTCAGKGGYTGYKTSDKPTQRLGAIAIDRRNNHIYFGYSTQSVLPDGLPDFEPAVVAMDEKGKIKWWNRLYQETSKNSTPDQYVDNMAIDYNSNTVVVLARCHGNNVDNFWKGNAITATHGANGFQNQFTGTNGNIHISWLGKLTLNEGTVKHTTYVAEYIEGTTNFGAALTNPNLEAWPNPNAGWPNVNTTRTNGLYVGSDGSVSIIGQGRRTMTTKNAYQKMPLPNLSGSLKGTWNYFIRTYAPDFSRPLYSSLLTGNWNQTTGEGGDNVVLEGLFKTESSVFAVGYHKVDASNVPMGVNLPISAIPTWGNDKPASEQAVFARLTADSLKVKPSCLPIKTNVQTLDNQGIVKIYPNPVSDQLTVTLENTTAARYVIIDLVGKVVNTEGGKISVLDIKNINQFNVPTANLTAGLYFFNLIDASGATVATLKFLKN